MSTVLKGEPIQQLADNPSYPVVFMTIKREGKTDSLTIRPSRFEYVSSVTAADVLEFTVPDPTYRLIDHELLIEDFKTEVEFRFGYEQGGRMSETITLLFIRQRPNFPETGPVETTLVCYDKSFLLTAPVEAKLFEGDGLTVKDLVQSAADWANEEFDADLDIDLGEFEYEELETYRVQKQPGSMMQFLQWLRTVARDPKTDMPPEVFVRNNTLYFRPARKAMNPVAYFRYHSPIPGSRLLSFEPEVNLRPSFKKVEGVDPVTGQAIETEGSNTAGLTRHSLTRHINANSGSHYTSPVSRFGDEKGNQAQPPQEVKTHKVAPGETLHSIAAKYNVPPEDLARANGLDPENHVLTPGQEIKVPVYVEGKGWTTDVARAQAATAYILDEDQTGKASATVIGDPGLEGGWPVWVENVGKKWRGAWYMTEVSHVIDNGVYTCSLTLYRDGIPIGKGLDATTGTEVNSENPPIVPASQQKQLMRHTSAETGASFTGN